MRIESHTGWRDRLAFSRAELLVVVGMTAILTGTLLPALSQSRPASTSAACLYNQGRLMGAFHSFAADNEDRCVAMAGTGGFWPSSGVGPGDSFEQRITKVQNALEQGPLWPYASDIETYHCPGDARTTHLQPGSGWAWGSYSRSGTVGHTGQIPNGGWDSSVTRFAMTSQIDSPAMTMVFIEEADPRNENGGAWEFNTGRPESSRGTYGWVDPLASFHGNWSTFAFADGHADGRTWVDARTIEASRTSTRGISSFYWLGGDPSNPDYRWVHERYRYVNYWPLP